MKYTPQIKSVAIKLPKNYYTNDMAPFSTVPNVSEYWWRLWGMEGRYMMDRSIGEFCDVFAEKASREAIKKAGLKIEDIDLILGASSAIGVMSEDEAIIVPGLTTLLKKRLNCKESTVTIEINNACLSSLMSLQIASNFIQSGKFKNILICYSEAFTNITDFCSSSSTTFGDATAALVVSRSENKDGGIISNSYFSNSTYNDLSPAEWRYPEKDKKYLKPEDLRFYFKMEDNSPRKMENFVPQNVPLVVNMALERAQLKSNDIDFYVFHQPSVLIIKAWAKILNISEEKYMIIMDKYANLGAVAMFLTLHEALKNKKIKSGNKIIFAGACVGWGFGAQVWEIKNDIN